MTVEAPAARLLMWLAGIVTPARKAEWRTAMESEFEALAGGAGSLGWAVGCVGAALGWRLRAEAVFLATLAVVVLAATVLYSALFPFVVEAFRTSDMSWMDAVTVGQHMLLGGFCFALAMTWPRRAALIGLVLPLTVSSGSIPGFALVILTHEAGAFPTLDAIGSALMFLGMEMWSSLLGAALGWAIARYRIRRAGPAVAL